MSGSGNLFFGERMFAEIVSGGQFCFKMKEKTDFLLKKVSL